MSKGCLKKNGDRHEKNNIVGPRFRIYLITYGGLCLHVYIDKVGRVTAKNGEPVHPYKIDGANACPHCTTKRNWQRLRRILLKNCIKSFKEKWR